MSDKEEIGNEEDDLLQALDDSDLDLKTVMETLTNAMQKSMSAMIGEDNAKN